MAIQLVVARHPGATDISTRAATHLSQKTWTYGCNRVLSMGLHASRSLVAQAGKHGPLTASGTVQRDYSGGPKIETANSVARHGAAEPAMPLYSGLMPAIARRC